MDFVCQKASAKFQAIVAFGSLLSALSADLFHRGRVRRVLQLWKKTCFRKGSIPTRDAVLSFSPGPLTSPEKRLVSIKDLVVSLCSFKGVDERWYMFEAMFIGVRVPLNKSLRT